MSTRKCAKGRRENELLQYLSVIMHNNMYMMGKTGVYVKRRHTDDGILIGISMAYTTFCLLVFDFSYICCCSRFAPAGQIT